ncbi:MAG TPA: hypothetical protein PKD16_19180 [Saprospiraceae bacterium]|jgi:hypothetical protein|nr:hypothetical protein [Saprospiraceae bacterium]HMT72297.1 hypothetical protein [Saprospiraceae bacterium]
MSTTELKSKVLKELESADDYLLEEILGLINSELKQNEVVKIPNHYEEALNKSIAQMKSGKTISNSEVEESIEKWLYK